MAAFQMQTPAILSLNSHFLADFLGCWAWSAGSAPHYLTSAARCPLFFWTKPFHPAAYPALPSGSAPGEPDD